MVVGLAERLSDPHCLRVGLCVTVCSCGRYDGLVVEMGVLNCAAVTTRSPTDTDVGFFCGFLAAIALRLDPQKLTLTQRRAGLAVELDLSGSFFSEQCWIATTWVCMGSGNRRSLKLTSYKIHRSCVTKLLLAGQINSIERLLK